MPDDDLKKYRSQLKTEVSLLSELIFKASGRAAERRQSVETYIETLIEADLRQGATWPPQTEKRDGPPAAKPETNKPN